jgi:general stress protein 26
MKNEERAKVYEILKGFSTAMFVTAGSDAALAARPMHVAGVNEDAAEVYFFTGQRAQLIEDIKRDDTVVLVFQDENSAYLSLRGNYQTNQDKARAKELWKEAYKVWFPGGLDDPNLALLSVHLRDAEYWDTRGTKKLSYMFEAAKAYMTGTTPNIPEGEQHAKTSL